jgi:hypothetical protein
MPITVDLTRSRDAAGNLVARLGLRLADEWCPAVTIVIRNQAPMASRPQPAQRRFCTATSQTARTASLRMQKPYQAMVIATVTHAATLTGSLLRGRPSPVMSNPAEARTSTPRPMTPASSQRLSPFARMQSFVEVCAGAFHSKAGSEEPQSAERESEPGSERAWQDNDPRLPWLLTQ